MIVAMARMLTGAALGAQQHADSRRPIKKLFGVSFDAAT